MPTVIKPTSHFFYPVIDKLVRKLFAILFFGLTCINIINAQQWSTPVEIIDTIAGDGVTGYYSKMIRVNNFPAIAYYDLTHTRLYFMRALNDSGTVWSQPIVVDNDGKVGTHLSIAIVNGHPAIAYHDELRSTLRYVRASDALGDSWNEPVVVDNGGTRGRFTSLAFINGLPMISYFNHGSSDLLFVRAADPDGNTWNAPQTLVSANSAGAGTSLMEVNGRPAIAFNYSVIGGTVKYVRALDEFGTQWPNYVNVDGTGGYYIQMMKINGIPVVAHMDPDIDRVRYIKANDLNGSSWGTAINLGLTIDDANYFSLDTLPGGIPAICYSDMVQQRLQFMKATNATASTWSSATTVSTTNYPGFYCSMIFQKGRFLIVHHTQTNRRLNLHRSSSSLGNAWNFVRDWKTSNIYGEHPSVVELGGKPAIAYYNYGTTQPCFVRASDAEGNQWPQPIIPIGGANRGEFPDMAIIAGKPAIAYYDEYVEYVVFQRATDSLGTNWNLSTDVYSSNELIDANPLIMNSGGFPAVAFHNGTGSSNALRYRRASDENGSSFTDFPGAADPLNGCGYYASYAEVNGSPALAYYDLLNANLRYTRAQNANSTGWITPIVVDSQGDVGQATSLCVVNGYPAISYFDETNYSLKYIRATNENGTAWGIPQILYNNGIAANQFSNKLFIYNGLPTLIFQGALGNLYCMRALDENGSQWSDAELIVDTRQTGKDVDVFVSDSIVHVTWFSIEDNSVYYMQGRPCDAPQVAVTTSNQDICSGSSLDLQAQGNGTIEWFDNANTITVLGNGEIFQTPPILSPTTYYVRSKTCGSSSALDSISIGIVQLEQPIISFINGNLVASPQPVNASWNWYSCNDSTLLFNNGPIYTPETANDVFVTYTENGCISFSQCFDIIITSAAMDKYSHEFRFIERDKIEFLNGPINYMLYDIAGKCISGGEASLLDISSLPIGLYIIRTDNWSLKFIH